MIESIIEENREIIIERWNDYFKVWSHART